MLHETLDIGVKLFSVPASLTSLTVDFIFTFFSGFRPPSFYIIFLSRSQHCSSFLSVPRNKAESSAQSVAVASREISVMTATFPCHFTPIPPLAEWQLRVIDDWIFGIQDNRGRPIQTEQNVHTGQRVLHFVLFRPIKCLCQQNEQREIVQSDSPRCHDADQLLSQRGEWPAIFFLAKLRDSGGRETCHVLLQWFHWPHDEQTDFGAWNKTGKKCSATTLKVTEILVFRKRLVGQTPWNTLSGPENRWATLPQPAAGESSLTAVNKVSPNCHAPRLKESGSTTRTNPLPTFLHFRHVCFTSMENFSFKNEGKSADLCQSIFIWISRCKWDVRNPPPLRGAPLSSSPLNSRDGQSTSQWSLNLQGNFIDLLFTSVHVLPLSRTSNNFRVSSPSWVSQIRMKVFPARGHVQWPVDCTPSTR